MSCKIFVNDDGTAIKVDAGEDISEATVIILYVRKPDNAVEQWDIDPAHWPGVDEDHPSNIIRYIVQDGDLDLVGKYSVQAYVELPAWKGRGETFTFKVWDYFE